MTHRRLPSFGCCGQAGRGGSGKAESPRALRGNLLGARSRAGASGSSPPSRPPASASARVDWPGWAGSSSRRSKVTSTRARLAGCTWRTWRSSCRRYDSACSPRRACVVGPLREAGCHRRRPEGTHHHLTRELPRPADRTRRARARAAVLPLPPREGVPLQHGGERARGAEGGQADDHGPAHCRRHPLQGVHVDCRLEIRTGSRADPPRPGRAYGIHGRTD